MRTRGLAWTEFDGDVFKSQNTRLIAPFEKRICKTLIHRFDCGPHLQHESALGSQLKSAQELASACRSTGVKPVGIAIVSNVRSSPRQAVDLFSPQRRIEPFALQQGSYPRTFVKAGETFCEQCLNFKPSGRERVCQLTRCVFPHMRRIAIT